MPKARYVVLIEGKVQKAGFRSFIKKHALSSGITGYAENLAGGEVIVVAEGDKKSLNEFVKLIEKQAPSYVKVEKITKREEKYRGSFADFERKGSDVAERKVKPQNESRKIKLTYFSTREAASFPGPVDVVFYNDENNKTYRLKHVDDNTFPITTIESLHRAMCVSKYAPEIIEGEIIGGIQIQLELK